MSGRSRQQFLQVSLPVSTVGLIVGIDEMDPGEGFVQVGHWD